MNVIRLAPLLALLCCNALFAEEAAKPTPKDRIQAAATEHRLKIGYDGDTFSGPGWDRLVEEGKAAQFFLLGEEHGIAENPMLAGQLFAELTNHGYSKFMIEISPTMAAVLDEALLKGGLDGLREQFAQPGGEPAFFGKKEEAEMLGTIRASVPASEPVLWGTDYEVGSDRVLLRMLQDVEKTPAAAAALELLTEASAASYDEYERTGSPQFIFSFAGDPEMVRAVIDAWPNPDPQSATILRTLERTLSINNLWMQRRAWASNAARADFQRDNFLNYWRAAKAEGETPRVMAKFGGSHIVRGLSQTAVYDLGALMPEIAALEGGHSFSIMVVPGAGSLVAVLDPSTWTFSAQPVSGGYLKGLEPLMAAAHEDTFTLIDLRPLREVVGMRRGKLHDELFRIVHGFDMLLVMSGSTAAGEFEHD